MIDGKTYYYLYNVDEKMIHVCSGGKTLCNLDTDNLIELNFPDTVNMSSLSSTVYKLCDKCANYKEPEVKKATFKTKAEFVDPEKEGKNDLE